ncbi:unnamed protein product, partial [Iphiclides podalirius]
MTSLKYHRELKTHPRFRFAPRPALKQSMTAAAVLHNERQFAVMWSNTSSLAWNIFTEISIRALLLLFLCVLHLRFEPEMHYITEAELRPEYRRPRRESRVHMQTVVAVIIFVPLFAISSQVLLGHHDGALRGLLGWNLALIANAVTTEALKLAVGRPRPDFFYRCYPDGVVTADRRCTGDEREVADGRKSFPSGHSSFAFCSLGYLALFLRRMARRAPPLVRPIPFAMAAIISATRVCDNRHHWQDVAAGALIGLLVAHFSFERYCPQRSRRRAGSESASSSSVSSSAGRTAD